MTAPRQHADLAARYFADDTLKCWVRNKGSNYDWLLLHAPTFNTLDLEYYVGHEPPPNKRTINLPAATIELRPGEQYAGLVLKDDGTPSHHLVRMAERPDRRLTWEGAKDWASKFGGALPTQREAPLIFAHCRSHTKPEWHWLSETYGGDGSYAWTCYFGTGSQDGNQKAGEYHVVAIRRIPIGGRDE